MDVFLKQFFKFDQLWTQGCWEGQGVWVRHVGGRGKGEEEGRVATTEPGAVGPDVVVFGVKRQNVCEEGDFEFYEETLDFGG